MTLRWPLPQHDYWSTPFADSLLRHLNLCPGATVLDVGTLVHKDIVQNMKYAKIWGSAKFEGQRVAKDYVVQNGDIIEFNW